jgi:hypothetical protein
VPNVRCPTCGLASYAVTPHSRASLCPYCDAELFPARHSGANGGAAAAAGEDDTASAGAEIEAEAA